MNKAIRAPILKELIKDQKVVHTVFPETPLDDAIHLMVSKQCHHIPVVRPTNQLVGIITDKDLRLATASPLISRNNLNEVIKKLHKNRVRDIMTTNVITASDDISLVEAAKILRFANVGCLPVVDDSKRDSEDSFGQLVGICTRGDILDSFIKVFEPTSEDSESNEKQ